MFLLQPDDVDASSVNNPVNVGLGGTVEEQDIAKLKARLQYQLMQKLTRKVHKIESRA